MNLLAQDIIVKGRRRIDRIGDIGLEFTLHNNSSLTFFRGDFKVGFITSSKLQSCQVGNNILEIIHMPDQNKISMYPEFGTFFPSAYTALKVFLSFYQPENLENIIMRLFTVAGTRDYPFKIEFP